MEKTEQEVATWSEQTARNVVDVARAGTGGAGTIVGVPYELAVALVAGALRRARADGLEDAARMINDKWGLHNGIADAIRARARGLRE